MNFPAPQNLKAFSAVNPVASGAADRRAAGLIASVRGPAGRYAVGEPASEHDKLVDQTRTWVATTFFGTLLKQMRNSPFKSEIFSGGRGGDAFGSLHDQQLAQHMARGAGNKLVNQIVRRLEANAAYGKQGAKPSSSSSAVDATDRTDNRTDPRRRDLDGSDRTRNRFNRSPYVAPALRA